MGKLFFKIEIVKFVRFLANNFKRKISIIILLLNKSNTILAIYIFIIIIKKIDYISNFYLICIPSLVFVTDFTYFANPKSPILGIPSFIKILSFLKSLCIIFFSAQ